MATSYQPTLRDYLSIARRRAVLLTVTFSIMFLGALLIAWVWPPMFRSTGTILVEGQMVPTELVQSTVTGFVEDRIDVISQRVMTRDNLLKVIDRHKPFPDDREDLSAAGLADRLRKRITIEIAGAGSPGVRWGKATIAFNVSFDDPSAIMAYQVANELVSLFLNVNARTRTERVTETTEFLANEADRQKADLETIEQGIAAYKREHASSLPEHQELRVGMLARVEADLRNIEREFRATQDELRFLDLELSAIKSGVGVLPSQDDHLSPAQELERLKNEYVKMRGTYTEAHPDVRDIKRKIEALSGDLEKGGSVTASPVESPIELAMAKVDAKMATANDRLKSLSQQEKELRANRSALEKDIIASPQVERGIATLMRDHENAQKEYEELRSKQMAAKLAENLEGEKKAERLTLLEAPLLPNNPVSPNRAKIVLIGLFAALGGSTGLAFLLEMLYPRIRGSAALAGVLRNKPLVVIPYIATEAEKVRQKRSIIMLVLAAGAVLVVTLLALHYLYMPLDMLFLKIMSRFW